MTASNLGATGRPGESAVGPTLAMARGMRVAGAKMVQPSKLYESAQRETREHYAAVPVLIEEKTRELYRHAMTEAGGLVDAVTQRPYENCPDCGWNPAGEPAANRCRACGVSKQQVLGKHDELRKLVSRAAPFVNAVAAMADDRGPALAWLADAALFVDSDLDQNQERP